MSPETGVFTERSVGGSVPVVAGLALPSSFLPFLLELLNPFWWPGNILPCGWAVSRLSVHQLIDTGLVFSLLHRELPAARLCGVVTGTRAFAALAPDPRAK